MSRSSRLLSKLNLPYVIVCVLSATLVAASCVAMSANEEPASMKDEPRAVPDELLVTFKPEIPEARKQEIHESVGGEVVNRMLNGRITQVKLKATASRKEAQEAYASFSEVEAVEPNYVSGIQQGGIETPEQKEEDRIR